MSPENTGAVGRVYHETHGHVLKIVIDNTTKKNSFSPEMMAELSDAMTLLDRDDESLGRVCCARMDRHFTAGLDMPKFFGPKATGQAAQGGEHRSVRFGKPVSQAHRDRGAGHLLHYRHRDLTCRRYRRRRRRQLASARWN